MENKIMFEGTEYQDNLIITIKIPNVPWRMRLAMLFSSSIVIKQDVYCSEIMPAHKCDGAVITVYSILDWLKSKFIKRQGMMHTPQPE